MHHIFILAMAHDLPTPLPVSVLHMPPPDWTTVVPAISAAVSALFALISAIIIGVGGVLAYRQLRVSSEAAAATSRQLALTAEQLRLSAVRAAQAVQSEAKRHAIDLINEIEDEELQEIMKRIFPNARIDKDAELAKKKFEEFLKAGTSRTSKAVDQDYLDAAIRLANFFDKADLYMASLVADQETFLNYFSPLIIQLFATLDEAYFRNPRFPPSMGIQRIAKKALEHYRNAHTGPTNPQFDGLDFG